MVIFGGVFLIYSQINSRSINLLYITNLKGSLLETFLLLPENQGCYFKKSLDAWGLVRKFLLLSRDWIAQQFQNKTIAVPLKFDLYLNLTWNG